MPQSEEILIPSWPFIEEFSKLHAKGKSAGPLTRTEEVTGVRKRAIQKILDECAHAETMIIYLHCHQNDIKFLWRALLIEAIRRKIYELNERKEHVTLTKLLKIVKEAELFNGERTKLRELLIRRWDSLTVRSTIDGIIMSSPGLLSRGILTCAG